MAETPEERCNRCLRTQAEHKRLYLHNRNCHAAFHDAPSQPPPGDKFEIALAELIGSMQRGESYSYKRVAVSNAHAEAVEAAFVAGHDAGMDEGFVKGRAAGVTEGRREMAREVLDKHYEFAGDHFHPLAEWLEARAGKEKKG